MERIIGLVFCGGASSRMGEDKMWLEYHGKPQVYHLYEQLDDICDDVFISCNQQQFDKIYNNYKCIIDNDTYGDIGPMKGLLTAIEMFPNTSFLIIGCDYPFLKFEDIELLYKSLLLSKKTVAYHNNTDNIIEPLLCGYHYFILHKLNNEYRSNNHSLCHFLTLNNVTKLLPSTTEILKSIDTHIDYLIAKEQLKKRV